MSEQVNKLERVRSAVDNLSKVWEHFPDFMKPDVKAFKAGIVIGEIPPRGHVPVYEGMKPELKEALNRIHMDQEPHLSSFTDLNDGTTYIAPDLLNEPQPEIDFILAYQASYFTYMRGERKEWADFDNDEVAMTNRFIEAYCDTQPERNKLYLVRRGFERKIYYDDGTGVGKIVAGLPPPGGMDNPDQFIYANSIFPNAFAILTNAISNREDDMQELFKNIGERKFTVNDFPFDNFNFALAFFTVTHNMDNIPWPIFDALLTGNTVETERRMHEFLKKDSDVQIFNFFLDGLSADESMMKNIQIDLEIIYSLLNNLHTYWQAKRN